MTCKNKQKTQHWEKFCFITPMLYTVKCAAAVDMGMALTST